MNLQNYFNYIDSVVKTFRDPKSGVYFVCLNDLIKLSKHVTHHSPEGIRRTILNKYKSNYPDYYIKDILLPNNTIDIYVSTQLVYELVYDLDINYKKLFTLWLSTKESMQIGNSFLQDIYEIEILKLKIILFKELNDIRNDSLDIYNCYKDSNGIRPYNPNDYIIAFMNKILSFTNSNINIDTIKRCYNINNEKDMINILSRETMEELIWYIRMCRYWIKTNLFPLGPINILDYLRFRFNEATFINRIDTTKRIVTHNGIYMIMDNRFDYKDTDKELVFQKYEQFERLVPLHVRVIDGVVYFKAVDVYNLIGIKSYNNRNIMNKQEQYNDLINSIPISKELAIPKTKARNPNMYLYPVEVLGQDKEFYNTMNEWINLANVNNINKNMLLEIPREKGLVKDLYISYALFPIISRDYPDNRNVLRELEVWLQTSVLPMVRKSYFITEMNKYINSELQRELSSHPLGYNNTEEEFHFLKIPSKYKSDIKNIVYSLSNTIIDMNKCKQKKDIKEIYYDLLNFCFCAMIGFGIDLDSLISFLLYAKETTKNTKFW